MKTPNHVIMARFKNTVYEASKNGKSLRELSKLFNISPTTAQKYIKQVERIRGENDRR